jgi:hypothetical protein
LSPTTDPATMASSTTITFPTTTHTLKITI